MKIHVLEQLFAKRFQRKSNHGTLCSVLAQMSFGQAVTMHRTEWNFVERIPSKSNKTLQHFRSKALFCNSGAIQFCVSPLNPIDIRIDDLLAGTTKMLPYDKSPFHPSILSTAKHTGV